MTVNNTESSLAPLLSPIADRACGNENESIWPAKDLESLASVGATKWAISRDWGGDDLEPMDLHDRYEEIASASLATALVLSQRDAGVGYLEASSNQSLKEELMPRLVSNQVWTTIGISHLTTSFHSGTLTAHRTEAGYMLSGTIPWVTGAVHSEFIIAAARTEDAQQIIFVLPTNRPGVTVMPPMKLATLGATATSAVDCVHVLIEPHLIIAGPAEKVLARRRKSVTLGQAFAAFGLTRAALKLMEPFDFSAALSTRDAIRSQYEELSLSVRQINQAGDAGDLQSGPLLRSECNNLAIRATHAALMMHKGTGLRLDHPAQRLAREGLFLLVWSSPASVTDRNLELISEPH